MGSARSVTRGSPWPPRRRSRPGDTRPQRSGRRPHLADPRRGGREPEPVGRERRAARHRSAFDSSQTTLNLIAVGYSLGLAASVLYLGALGDRYGRKLMLVLGMVLSIPACLLAACAPSDKVLFARTRSRRALGRHGLSDDARADHRALGRTAADEGDRAVVGARRRRSPRSGRSSRARCSSTSGGARCSS